MNKRNKRVNQLDELFICNLCGTAFRGKSTLTVKRLRDGRSQFSRTRFRCPKCHGTKYAAVGGRTLSDRLSNLGLASEAELMEQFGGLRAKGYVEQWVE